MQKSETNELANEKVRVVVVAVVVDSEFETVFGFESEFESGSEQ